MNRRRFLKRAGLTFSATALCGGAYSLFEAGSFSEDVRAFSVPALPAPFRGTKLAFLTDLHHGPYTGLEYLRRIVARVNSWQPDIVLLGGDYVHAERAYIAPVFELLKALHAPLGVYGVLGNHDHWQSAAETRDAMRNARIVDVTNVSLRVSRANAAVRICGVGDLWTDTQDLDGALADARPGDCTLLLSHNPDFAERPADPRVSMVFSGHTHGGQVRVPLFGAPYVPSRFGNKYAQGLIHAPLAPVFVSRGLGSIGLPVRFCCRPEYHLLTLQ